MQREQQVQRPRGQRNGTFGEVMLLSHSVRSEEQENKFGESKQGSDHKDPHRYVKESELYPKWYGEAIKCFQQVNNMTKFGVRWR